ncbi:MAG: TlpA family protein disulfide reductase [Prevotellaceae bacterium]|jgi:peroxiredoxin|nr:TlpA family protein disulfide reductase [Prevotellaceae bacterium]
MKQLFLYILFFVVACPVFSQSAEKQRDDTRGYIVKVGDTAPDFTIKYLDGKTEKLSDLWGKVVMLQFTASWCGVCRKEMPHIESEIWQKHKSNPDFALLGISYKENEETTKNFAQKIKISYPLTLDESGEIFHKYATKNAGVTRNIIINREGKIIFLTRLFDETEFKQMVDVIKKELDKKN